MKRGTSIRYYARYIKRDIKFEYRIIRRLIRTLRRKVKKYPSTIQLPITHLCNFDCVMCGMHHMIGRRDFSAQELSEILSNELFSKIKFIGVNGGEPFLKKDFIDCIKVMIKNCSLLEEINIISNGYFTKKIVNVLQLVGPICRTNNVRLNIAISVDGIEDMQDFHRGKENAYINAVDTIKALRENSYVDSVSCICTITKHNIYRINEVELWAEENDIDVSYNIATEHVRIENQDKVSDFTIFSDEQAKLLATEFFYKQYCKTKQEKYFGLFLFLKDRKRYSVCPCQFNEWVTLTPDAEIGYCATHSKKLGSALEKSAYDIFRDNNDYLEELKYNYCEYCSHYMYELNVEGLKKLKKEELKNEFVRG